MSSIPVSRTPSCADSVLVDPKKGVAAVAFMEGFSCLYKNVGTKVIKNLPKDRNVSEDEWVNTNFKKPRFLVIFFAKIVDNSNSLTDLHQPNRHTQTMKERQL